MIEIVGWQHARGAFGRWGLATLAWPVFSCGDRAAGGRRPCGACRVIAAVIASDLMLLLSAIVEIDTLAVD
jgi:hypothetical protein